MLNRLHMYKSGWPEPPIYVLAPTHRNRFSTVAPNAPLANLVPMRGVPNGRSDRQYTRTNTMEHQSLWIGDHSKLKRYCAHIPAGLAAPDEDHIRSSTGCNPVVRLVILEKMNTTFTLQHIPCTRSSDSPVQDQT